MWPGRVPLTTGTSRTPFDVLLYGALLVLLTLTFLFTGIDMIVAAKIVFVVIWMGAAISKLNQHFPFVVSTMMSNNPILRPKVVKRMFFERFPDDLRPGRPSRILAHGGTAVEMCVPLVLFFSHGGWPTAIAATVMICFHLTILAAIPMGVPLEWNVFMIFGVLTLFVGHADFGLVQSNSPVALGVLFAVLAGIVILGNLFPAKISFLPGMRYYAGNWDTTLWCLTPSAEAKIRAGIIAVVAMPAAQPIHTRTQRYRLVDAATGEFESGTVRVDDMVTRQPWDDDLPVYPAPR